MGIFMPCQRHALPWSLVLRCLLLLELCWSIQCCVALPVWIKCSLRKSVRPWSGECHYSAALSLVQCNQLLMTAHRLCLCVFCLSLLHSKRLVLEDEAVVNLWCCSPTCLEGTAVILLESVLSDHETMTQSLDKHVNDSLLVSLISSIWTFFFSWFQKIETTLKVWFKS